jgi:Putative zinc-finger
MAGEHPSEPTLLAYVEDELDGAARETVEAHLAECEACAADVAFVRTGRETARQAPLLEAPAGLGDRVGSEITPPMSARPATARRWLGIVAPVAAALAIAGGIATLAVYTPGGGGDDSAGEGAAIAEESAGDTGGGEEAPGNLGVTGAETAPAEAEKDQAFTLSVAADPEELARELRRAGFDARAEGRTVVVATARLADLRSVLRNYPRGGVRVEVE